MKTATVLNALSIDVEEHFQVTAFDGIISRDQWADMPSRVVNSTRRILDLERTAKTVREEPADYLPDDGAIENDGSMVPRFQSRLYFATIVPTCSHSP